MQAAMDWGARHSALPVVGHSFLQEQSSLAVPTASQLLATPVFYQRRLLPELPSHLLGKGWGRWPHALPGASCFRSSMDYVVSLMQL